MDRLYGMPVVTNSMLTDTKSASLRRTRATVPCVRKAYQRVRRRFPVWYWQVPRETIYRMGDTLIMHPAMLAEFNKAVVK